MNEIERRFKSIQEALPDTEDIEAISRIAQANDSSNGITLDEMDRLRMSRFYRRKASSREAAAPVEHH